MVRKVVIKGKKITAHITWTGLTEEVKKKFNESYAKELLKGVKK